MSDMEESWEIAMMRLSGGADLMGWSAVDVLENLSTRMGKKGMRHTCALAKDYDLYIPECRDSPNYVKPKKDQRGNWNTYDREEPNEIWRPEVAEAIDKYKPKRKSPRREDRRYSYGFRGPYG